MCFDLSLNCNFVCGWFGFVFLQDPAYSCQQHIWWYRKDGTITMFCSHTSHITYQAKEHLLCLPAPRVLRLTWDFTQILLEILLPHHASWLDLYVPNTNLKPGSWTKMLRNKLQWASLPSEHGPNSPVHAPSPWASLTPLCIPHTDQLKHEGWWSCRRALQDHRAQAICFAPSMQSHLF